MGVKVIGLKSGLSNIKKITKQSTKSSMGTIVDDLTQVASDTAPVDEGVLETSGTNGLIVGGTKIEGWVKFEAWANAKNRSYDFNYAIWIHEATYNLGPKSLMKSGGNGMSGAHYAVGNKYLTRPLYGEANTYRDLIEENLKNSL